MSILGYLQEVAERLVYPQYFQEQPEIIEAIDGTKIRSVRLTPRQLNIFHKNAPAVEESIKRSIYNIKSGGIIPSFPIIEGRRVVGFKDEEEVFKKYISRLDGRTTPEKILGKIFYKT